MHRDKKLFKPDGFGGLKEFKLTWIVDFYIHSSFQGQGYGKQFIENLLNTEYFSGGQVGFQKPSSTFTKFLNRWYNYKYVLKSIDDEFYFINRLQSDNEKAQFSSSLARSGSQTNLNILNNSLKQNNDRGKIFNSIGKDVIKKSTSDLHAYVEDSREKATYNGEENKFINDRNGYSPSRAKNLRTEKMRFDEFLSEYEMKKHFERNRSPGEHRSKYFNDVFNSNLSIGNNNPPSHGPKIISQLTPHTQRAHFNNNKGLTNVLEGESSFKPTYIPEIPETLAHKTLNSEEIYKPKNRYKNWTPSMRNLESTYEVKDVRLSSEFTDGPLIDPTRRVQIGGKKLFMCPKEGIGRAHNYPPGYMPPSYG